ncbi:MAG TPA: DUF4124 domain-containing protein [Rhodocyclaceae bacterium]|nr:DUF4124 domain-containing protein [Rhodocyclaceae bacterium]
MRRPVILVLLLASPLALAQIYTWRGADGVEHYADRAPADTANVRKLETDRVPPGDVERARRALANQEAAFNKHQQEAREAAVKAEKDKADAEERQRNCDQAKSYLRALASGVRITRTGKNGERAFLNDRERDQEKRSAQQTADSWCQ